MLLKAVLKENTFNKFKIFKSAGKKSLCSGTRVKPCFSQRMTAVLRPAEIEVNKMQEKENNIAIFKIFCQRKCLNFADKM